MAIIESNGIATSGLVVPNDNMNTLPLTAATESPSLVVTTTEDVVDANDGVTSLREAIAYAQAIGGEQAITFAEDFDIVLNDTLTISSNVAIDGGDNRISIYVPMFENADAIVFEGEELRLTNLAFAGTGGERYEDDFDSRILVAKSGNTYINGCCFTNLQSDSIVCSRGSDDIFISVENTCFIDNNAVVLDFEGSGLVNNVLIFNDDYSAAVVWKREDHAGEDNRRGTLNLINTTILDTAQKSTVWGWTAHGQSDFNILNTVIVNYCDNGKGFYSNMGSETKARNSIYTSGRNEWSSYSDFTDNVTGVSASDLFPNVDSIELFDKAGFVRDMMPDAEILAEGAAALAAVDENNVLYYSVDGTNWFKYSDRSQATVDSSWILNKDFNGNIRTAENNKIGALIKPFDPLVVTTAADVVDANDGVTSLREAIAYAQSLGGEQTIGFNMADGDTVSINDPALVSRDFRFASTNAADGNPVTVVLNELSISGRSTSFSWSPEDPGKGGSVMYIFESNISVIGGEYINNRCDGQGGSGGAFRVWNGSLTVEGTTFQNNYAYSNGGAIMAYDGATVTICNSHFEGNNVWGYGGALMLFENTETVIVDTDFVNNSTGYSTYYNWSGGAIHIIGNSNLIYTVSADKTVTNTGNDSTYGGFIAFRNAGTASAEFRIDGTLNIGNGDGKDSFASVFNVNADGSDHIIRKTGSGTMTINAPVADYDGKWFIEKGVLSFAYADGGDFDGDIVISGGQILLEGDFTFQNLTFQLANSGNGVAYISDLAKLSGGTFTVDASHAASGTYKLAGNAADFAAAMSLTVGGNTYENALSVGNRYVVGDRSYALALDTDNTLTLMVADGPVGIMPEVVLTITDPNHNYYGATGGWKVQADQTVEWQDISMLGAGYSYLGLGVTAANKAMPDIYVYNAGAKYIAAYVTDETGAITGFESIFSGEASLMQVGLADFNGDGVSDLLLRTADGFVGTYANGAFSEVQGLGLEWSVVALGDLDGNGRADVVIAHDAGYVGAYLVGADGSISWADLGYLERNTAIVGAGDVNADGTDDVIVQVGANYYGAWLCGGGAVTGFFGIGTFDAEVQDIADHNADGTDDLLLRTASGVVGAALITGADATTWSEYGALGAEWSTKGVGIL